MFEGAIVAIVTPFKNGQIDEDALDNLIQFQIASGTAGIVPCGTTGESTTLSHDEHDRVIEVTIKSVNKKVPVIAGTGSNSTEEALRLTLQAYKAGADGAMIVCPYYNRPTQEGLYQHYKTIAEEVPIPILIYNIPGRTGVNLNADTLVRLAQIPNIVGIKEAGGSIKQMSDMIELCGPDFDVISGDDALTLPLMALGGKGVVSVMSNIVPADMAELVRSCKAGNFEKARKLHHKMAPLVEALFIETNPVPVKAALAMMGMIEDGVRRPLCKLSPESNGKLRKAMSDYGLI